MNRCFLGIWIPVDFYLCRDFNWTEKLLILEINSLDRDDGGCYAKNEHFANHLGITADSVSRILNKLRDDSHISIGYGIDGCRYVKLNDKLKMILRPVIKQQDITADPTVCKDEEDPQGCGGSARMRRIRKDEEGCMQPCIQSYATVHTEKKGEKEFKEKFKGKINGKDIIPTLNDEHEIDKDKWINEESKALIESTPKAKPIFDHNSEAYGLAMELLNGIITNQPDFMMVKLKNPKVREKLLQLWAYDFDLLLRVDGKSFDVVVEVLNFTVNHNFWWKCILSGGKFREQYERLRAEMGAEGDKGKFIHNTSGDAIKTLDPNLELTNKIIKMFGHLINNSDYQPPPEIKYRFINAAACAKKFFESRSIIPENWIKHLSHCLDANYRERGNPVLVGHLDSHNTWEILMPQYLIELGM